MTLLALLIIQKLLFLLNTGRFSHEYTIFTCSISVQDPGLTVLMLHFPINFLNLPALQQVYRCTLPFCRCIRLKVNNCKCTAAHMGTLLSHPTPLLIQQKSFDFTRLPADSSPAYSSISAKKKQKKLNTFKQGFHPL